MSVDINSDIESLLSAITSGQVRASAKLISRIERD